MARRYSASQIRSKLQRRSPSHHLMVEAPWRLTPSCPSPDNTVRPDDCMAYGRGTVARTDAKPLI